MDEKIFTIDGKTFTESQLKELRESAAAAAKITKAAEKAGFIEKAKKAPKEKEPVTPETQKLIDDLKVIIDGAASEINRLFEASKTTEKPMGQIGIELVLEGNFNVQLLNKATRKAKAAASKKTEAPAPAPETEAATEAKTE